MFSVWFRMLSIALRNPELSVVAFVMFSVYVSKVICDPDMVVDERYSLLVSVRSLKEPEALKELSRYLPLTLSDAASVLCMADDDAKLDWAKVAEHDGAAALIVARSGWLMSKMLAW